MSETVMMDPNSLLFPLSPKINMCIYQNYGAFTFKISPVAPFTNMV